MGWASCNKGGLPGGVGIGLDAYNLQNQGRTFADGSAGADPETYGYELVPGSFEDERWEPLIHVQPGSYFTSLSRNPALTSC